MGKYIPQISVSAILLATIMSAGCSDSKQMKEDLRMAGEMGHERAMELKENPRLDTMIIESTLLDVRSREHRLRAEGHERVADAYIGAFMQTLDSVNPSLASELR